MPMLRDKDGKQYNEQATFADRRVCAERTSIDIQLNKDNGTENRSVGLKQRLYKAERGKRIKTVRFSHLKKQNERSRR